MLHYCFYLKSSNLFQILSLRKGNFCLLLLATTIITASDGEKQKKNSEDKLDSYKKMRNEQSGHYDIPPKASTFFRYYDYRITLLLRHSFFTHIKD